MSTLNLTPNPAAVVVQAALFLTNVVIIKKLMLDPYLKIKARRDALTVGSKDEASRLVTATSDLNSQITKKMQDAQSSIRTEVEGLRTKANAERAALISAAEKTAKDSLAQLQSSIGDALAQERQKMPQVARTIAQQFAERVLS